jgi:hypothetical protein
MLILSYYHMIYILNYYNRKLTTQMAILYYPKASLYYPNGDLIKFKEFQMSPIVV